MEGRQVTGVQHRGVLRKIRRTREGVQGLRGHQGLLEDSE